MLSDFGGTMNGYCSDITRCVYLGTPPAEVADAYAVLHEAQQAAVAAGIVGASCEEVDRVARGIITAAGFGDYFVHRTGHGIGMEAHEDPYMVEGNELPLAPGHAFSRRAGDLHPGAVGHAARGHRRRRRATGRSRSTPPATSSSPSTPRLARRPCCQGPRRPPAVSRRWRTFARQACRSLPGTLRSKVTSRPAVGSSPGPATVGPGARGDGDHARPAHHRRFHRRRNRSTRRGRRRRNP